MSDNKKQEPEQPAVWIRVKGSMAGNFKCSRCMTHVNIPTVLKVPQYRFCPFCGALMSKEV